MTRLSENQKVDNYLVVYFIKETLFCASYRVMDTKGRSLFMKVFDLNMMPKHLLLNSIPKEIVVCKKLHHKNIVSYVDSGSIILEGNKYGYLITEFFIGELLSDALLFNGMLTLDDRFRIAIGITEGLQYMSSEADVSYNDLCARNIVLVSDPETAQLVPKIIDLGHSSEPFPGRPAFPEVDIDMRYRAPETFSGDYSFRSDVFSLSVLIYALFFDRFPWNMTVDEDSSYRDKVTKLLSQREGELETPIKYGKDIKEILQRGLSPISSMRPTYDEILSVLRNGHVLAKEQLSREEPDPFAGRADCRKHPAPIEQKGGFDDVAGMDDLKKELRDKVIWVLTNKEVAEQYRITPPNGMLLYGPPGCGKTFFAQKFAEESGFHYKLVNGSDIGSTLIHGNQIKIGELFQEAEEHAPTVLCFDEFDSFVPVRGAHGSEYAAEEVNEFLAQLNNCAKRGIFVIGTTNRKDMIDPAVLRKGRLDLQILIPAPDFETRKMMFRKHLRNRPLADDIDYDKLAEMTDNYASSDIAFIVNEAAIAAALARELISQRHLEGAIKGNKSSLETACESRFKLNFAAK